jgi:hypothetical protein
VPIFGYAKEATKIRELGRECGIEGDGQTHLVIDDATLYAYARLRQPINLLYISDAVYLGDDLKGEKVIDLLRRLGSPGVVARCTYMASALWRRSHMRDGYCCVSAQALLTPLPGP